MDGSFLQFVLQHKPGGWYLLPGTQGYYGADKTDHALVGALTGQGLLFGIDDACGPTAKIVYDAASLADPDLDYNDFDTDKDGVVQHREKGVAVGLHVQLDVLAQFLDADAVTLQDLHHLVEPGREHVGVRPLHRDGGR